MSVPITRELLRALPKAELHCHLDGSLRPETMLELGLAYGKPMPAADPAALRELMVVRDARNLDDYLARFETTLSVMQRSEALERIACELVEDAARDGIRYIEVRFCPLLNTREGLSLEEALEAVLRGVARGQSGSGTIARVIVCTLRHLRPEVSLELARLAVAYRGQGVVAFDLAGSERGRPARPHVEAFAYARANDLAVTVHAGEGDGPESIREALHDCGANRLGHAARLREDQSLSQYVNDHCIPLEVCLTSNVQTRVAGSYDTHPLRQYFDAGMVVVLNTDNTLMSGVSLADEYLLAASHLGFDFDELCELALNGFSAAFLPWQERTVLLDKAWTAIQSLGAPPA